MTADREGRLVDIFGTGTNQPLMQIKRVVYKDSQLTLGEHEHYKTMYPNFFDMILNEINGDNNDRNWITQFE